MALSAMRVDDQALSHQTWTLGIMIDGSSRVPALMCVSAGFAGRMLNRGDPQVPQK